MASRGADPTGFGARIAMRREMAGLTQKALGAKLGVEGSTVSHWETELHDPPVEALLQMREIFGVSLDWLLGATDTPPAPTVNLKRLRRAMKKIETGLAAMDGVAHGLGEMAAALPPPEEPTGEK